MYKHYLQILLSSLLFFATTVAMAGDMVPFKGKFEGRQGHFTGHATHLGKWEQVGPPWEWIAANGDILTVTFSNFTVIKFDPPFMEYKQTMQITGGTGRFKTATGFADTGGIINVDTRDWDGYINGQISRPNSGKE